MASILWVDEDFDKNIFVEVNNNAIPLAQNMGSWCGRAVAGAGTALIDYLQVDNVVGHLGILRIPTGSTQGNTSIVFLGRDSQAGGPAPSEVMVPMDAFIQMDAYVRIPTITSVNCMIGLGNDISNGAFGTDSVRFDYASSAGANWRAITRAAGTQTVVDMGVAVVAGAWYKLTLRRFTAANQHMHGTVRGAAFGSYCFYINDVTEPLRVGPSGPPSSPAGLVHIPTNVSTVDMVLGAYVSTLANPGARNFDIDRIRLWIDDAAMVG
jgi:hypothetical protein